MEHLDATSALKQPASGKLAEQYREPAWLCDDPEGWGEMNQEGGGYMYSDSLIVQQKPTQHHKEIISKKKKKIMGMGSVGTMGMAEGNLKVSQQLLNKYVQRQTVKRRKEKTAARLSKLGPGVDLVSTMAENRQPVLAN